MGFFTWNFCFPRQKVVSSDFVPVQLSPLHHVSALNSPLPDHGLCNCTPLLGDGVRGVTVTKTGSGAIVVSAKSERKRGISVQNTNQLAGNRTFISPLTLISLQGKCPLSHLTASLSLPWVSPTHGALSPSRPRAAMSMFYELLEQIAAGQQQRATGITEVTWEAMSRDKCRSVTGVPMDRVNKLQDGQSERK